MNERLTSVIEPINQWWKGISPREKLLVIVLSVLLVIASIYWGVIAPLQAQKASAEQRLISERQLYSWVEDKANQITSLRAERGQVRVNNQALNQVVSSSVKRYKIDLQRVQPRDEALQVVIGPLAFNTLVQWLEFLQKQYGVKVEFMDINQTDTEGVVEVKRLQLTR
ncbi:general secretion pathway protein GspM [Vibrio sp. qd031]|uniref:type II secretion system protein GspM n=1 Tax=Vibrio sp. qd031 TaxID=1603038 RepID=UPI000A119A03|nr:type II secretion system protein M [Vibrio sp. qd031]ORT51662.1 general secretion pathway protein GspM [Vibrio sp. qd031]